MIEAINASGAELLLVALGVPRQEKWIASVRSLLQVPPLHGRRGPVRLLFGHSEPRATLDAENWLGMGLASAPGTG